MDIPLSEDIRNWAIVAGGAFGLWLAYSRTRAANRQSDASQSQAETQERTYSTDVFNSAVGQLSSDHLEVRLGAIYALTRLSEDDDAFEFYVIGVFEAYVRERTVDSDRDAPPPADVAAIVSFLHEKTSQQGR